MQPPSRKGNGSRSWTFWVLRARFRWCFAHEGPNRTVPKCGVIWQCPSRRSEGQCELEWLNTQMSQSAQGGRHINSRRKWRSERLREESMRQGQSPDRDSNPSRRVASFNWICVLSKGINHPMDYAVYSFFCV
jgi:hypothetical protein